MRRISRLTLGLGSALLCFGTAYSGIPNNDNPTTFLGPTLRAGYTSPLTDTTAYSVAGEAGIKNFRLGGTIGWKIVDNQRFKLSAEYLTQKITYAFFAGDTNQWVQQGAIGADYQYEFLGYDYNPQADLNIYYSHAPSKSLGTETGTFVNRAGIIQSFIDQRRIAGSNAGGISPGLTVQPWVGGKVGVALNYDDVHYNKNNSPSENAVGFGGTVSLNQAITKDVSFGASAAVRQPFNNYQANVTWSNVPYFGNWALGVDGAYTAGKNTLPNTYNVGLTANYFMDQKCETAAAQRETARKFMDLKGDLKGEAMPAPQPAADDFLAWTADPAVYMPQVLAVTDEKVTKACAQGVPTFTGTITGGAFAPSTIQTFNSPSQFTGSDLTYTVTSTQIGGGTSTVSINSSTGAVTVTGVRSTTNITITATNQCGAVSSNTFAVIFD